MRTEFADPKQLDKGCPALSRVARQSREVPVGVSTLLLCVLVLTAQFGPTIPVYLGLASSRASGMILAAAIIAFVMALSWCKSARVSKQSILDVRVNGVLLCLMIVIAVVIHGLVANQFQRIDFGRFILSLVPLVFLLVGGVALGNLFGRVSVAQLHVASWASFWAFVAVIVLRILRLEPPGVTHNNPTFPFTEVSYFALAFGPILLYRTVTAPAGRQFLWILFGLGLAVALKNATLVVFALGAALICRRLLTTISVIAIPLLAGAASHLTYFTSRADISSHSSSVSALVYLQGWELLMHSLAVSRGWGIGFQQLGVHHAHLLISQLIRKGNRGVALNLEDGSFLFSKFGSEFGVFGIVLVLGYCVMCLRSIHSLRSFVGVTGATYIDCIVVAFGVDMFIRGINYFYGEPLMFLGAVAVLHVARRSRVTSEEPRLRVAQDGEQ